MSVYKLYYRRCDDKTLITENDIVMYRRKENTWVKEIGINYEFMVGDLALDNGFELQRKLTERELFVEFL